MAVTADPPRKEDVAKETRGSAKETRGWVLAMVGGGTERSGSSSSSEERSGSSSISSVTACGPGGGLGGRAGFIQARRELALGCGGAGFFHALVTLAFVGVGVAEVGVAGDALEDGFERGRFRR